jgi:hypothetical protein
VIRTQVFCYSGRFGDHYVHHADNEEKNPLKNLQLQDCLKVHFSFLQLQVFLQLQISYLQLQVFLQLHTYILVPLLNGTMRVLEIDSDIFPLGRNYH